MNFNYIFSPLSLAYEMGLYMSSNYNFVYNHYNETNDFVEHVFTLQYNKANLLYVRYRFASEEVSIKMAPYTTPYKYTESTAVLRLIGNNQDCLDLLSKETYILLKENGITGLNKSW